MILHYLKTAFRSLQRNKFYSALSIGGFAVGFAVCIIIGLYVYSEFSVDKGFKDHERIYRLVDVDSKFIDEKTTAFDYNLRDVLKNNYSEIERVAPYKIGSGENFLLLTDNKSFKYDYSMKTTDEMFDLLSLKIIEKSRNNNLLDNNSVVLTQSMADRMFEGENALGKRIELDDGAGTELFVSAVVEDLPLNTSFPNISIFLNIERGLQRSQMERDGYSVKPVNYYVKLMENISPVDFTNKLNSSLKNYQKIHEKVELQPIQDIYMSSTDIDNFLSDSTKKGNVKMILLLASIAILILVLSVINYINYSIAQHQSQIKSIGIRTTNGAALSNIFKYFLSESFIGIFIAIVLALILSLLFLPFANQIIRKQNQHRIIVPANAIPVFYPDNRLCHSYQYTYTTMGIGKVQPGKIPLKGGDVKSGGRYCDQCTFRFTIYGCHRLTDLPVFYQQTASFCKTRRPRFSERKHHLPETKREFEIGKYPEKRNGEIAIRAKFIDQPGYSGYNKCLVGS